MGTRSISISLSRIGGESSRSGRIMSTYVFSASGVLSVNVENEEFMVTTNLVLINFRLVIGVYE